MPPTAASSFTASGLSNTRASERRRKQKRGLRCLNETVIRLDAINKSYRNGAEELHVLRDVSLGVQKGEFVSIMGASGSGKSTLLNILGILDQYDSGTYHLGERLVRDLSENDAAQYRNRFIGFVFQAFHLLGFKTALENVALPLYYQGLPRRQRNQIAAEYLARVGLASRANHLPSQLSGGEQQRVAVARSLVTQPEVLLADEPTGALDSRTSHELMDLFRDIHRQGLTIILVTHERTVAERTDRTVFMKDGRVAEA